MILRIISIIIYLLASQKIFADNIHNHTNFWDHPKKGTNIFNKHITRDDIKAAKRYGMDFVRLAPDKFLTEKKDFLIGDSDHYTGIVKSDMIHLKNILNMFAEENMPVILTMLSLPGSCWKQNNNNKDDLRIWSDNKFQIQSAEFWKDLVAELADHPAIIGINILNEPHPEKIYYNDKEVISINEEIEIQRELYDFYAKVIASIRAVSKHIPIILDSSNHADPKKFKYLKAHNDKNIIYSFHMYEPYEYTNKKLNKGRYIYPGYIKNKYYDKQMLSDYFQDILDFQLRNNISPHKVLVGEFGANRDSVGISEYFKDLKSIFEENNWHYAFYAFREDTWNGMNYEQNKTIFDCLTNKHKK